MNIVMKNFAEKEIKDLVFEYKLYLKDKDVEDDIFFLFSYGNQHFNNQLNFKI